MEECDSWLVALFRVLFCVEIPCDVRLVDHCHIDHALFDAFVSGHDLQSEGYVSIDPALQLDPINVRTEHLIGVEYLAEQRLSLIFSDISPAIDQVLAFDSFHWDALLTCLSVL